MSTHYKEERPWGNFEILYEEKGLKVKRITVQPDKRLSLQSHEHRSENWVVVAGQAVVTLAEEDIPRGPNQAIYIPAGVKHRMANYGQEPVVFIEVQTGSYLGEDDIVRYQDDYQR